MKKKIKIGRKDEINIIAYKIKNALILGKSVNGGFFVNTSDGIFEYSEEEMEEVFGLDMLNSDFERLGWPA